MAGSAANLTSHGIRKMANSITSKELKALLENDPEVVLLDVRRKADYEAAPQTIGSGVWRDPEKVDEWSDEIPRDRLVVVYCVKGGAVSQSVADRLQQSHPDVRFLEGGIKAWAELGEPEGEDK
jgi:rhodanese-related sulfurtransferase